MKNCPKCKVEHSKHGMFCSRSCANSRGPRTEEFKQLVRAKLKGVSPASKGKYLVERVSRTCQSCSISFITKINSNNLFCSPSCRPNIKGGYREGSGRAKTGYFRGIYCGSTYELVWVIYRLDHNLPVTRFNGFIVYGNNKKYYPDFIEDSIIHEMKGWPNTSIDPTLNEKELGAKKAGYQVRLYFREDLQKEFDWVKQNYIYKELFELYDGYKPKFNFKCSHCGNDVSRNGKPKTEVLFCSRACAGRYQKAKNIMTSELRNTISTSLKGRTVKPYKRKFKQIWITNGKINTRIKESDLIPEGFKRGRTKSL
jgi:hypothetical protein